MAATKRTPRIAITPCRSLTDYVASIRRFGGESFVLDPAKDPADRVLEEVDGLLLTGGGDVDPAKYGEARHPTVADVDPKRDAYELELTRRALEKDLPVLAICRGVQVLNVAGQGSLIQDIPSQTSSDLTHTVKSSKTELAHEVSIAEGSLLSKAMGAGSGEVQGCQVNSRHHQAIKNVAAGFKVSAVAPDGVIEAIERPGARFCLGVQWHPENFCETGEFRSLFEAFLEAAGQEAGLP